LLLVDVSPPTGVDHFEELAPVPVIFAFGELVAELS